MIAALRIPELVQQELTWLEQRLASIETGSVNALNYLDATMTRRLWTEVRALQPHELMPYRFRLQMARRTALRLSGGIDAENPHPVIRRVWHETSALITYLR